MSLVGPRPEVPFHVEHLGRGDRFPCASRYAPAARAGHRSTACAATQTHERIRYDIWYIENWTVALDIKIIFRTVFGGKMVNDEKLQ